MSRLASPQLYSTQPRMQSVLTGLPLHCRHQLGLGLQQLLAQLLSTRLITWGSGLGAGGVRRGGFVEKEKSLVFVCDSTHTMD